MEDGDAVGSKGQSYDALDENVLAYSIGSVSSDINDCRLQITRRGQARWYRERSLSAEDEIVDLLIDAKTGRVVWTSQKPLKGWYLYLTAPTLPQGTAVPLLPVKGSSSGSTPLSLSVGTRLNSSWLADIREEITLSNAAVDPHPVLRDDTNQDSRFTAISLDTLDPGDDTDKGTEGNADRTLHARSSSRNLNLGHARRRSGGNHMKSNSNSRNVSRSSVPGVGMLGEVYEEEEETDRGQAKLDDKSSRQPSLCRFVITESGGAAKVGRQKTSWARWAWKGIPIALGTPLDFDSSKEFSIMWINAPSESESTITSSKEILRYQDDSSWSNWRGKKRGDLLIQHAAIKALRIEVDFWVAVSSPLRDRLVPAQTHISLHPSGGHHILGLHRRARRESLVIAHYSNSSDVGMLFLFRVTVQPWTDNLRQTIYTITHTQHTSHASILPYSMLFLLRTTGRPPPFS